MQVQLNCPVSLGGKTYGTGQHSIPEKDACGWFFEGLVAEGKAVVLRVEGVVNTPAEVKPVRKAPVRRKKKIS